jgi:hypothetical protein
VPARLSSPKDGAGHGAQAGGEGGQIVIFRALVSHRPSRLSAIDATAELTW